MAIDKRFMYVQFKFLLLVQLFKSHIFLLTGCMQLASSAFIFTLASSKKRCIFMFYLVLLTMNFNCLFTCRTRGKYGEGDMQEKFTYTLALVCVQCVVNYIYAKISKFSFYYFHHIFHLY